MAAPSHQQTTTARFDESRTFVNYLFERITDDLKQAEDDARHFLEHCKERCSSLLELESPGGDLGLSEDAPGGDSSLSEDAQQEVIRKTTHLVLDYTYLGETRLVDAEFPADTCMDTIGAIQGLLDQVCDVAGKCFKSKTLLECLGAELVECIHWRKGALLYMYCHTIETQGRSKDAQQYKQCLEEGVRHLEAMLSTQSPQSVSENVGPDDTLQLISQGVYSDTHLLAAIYAAELCYWHQQAADKGLFPQDKSSGSSFMAKEHGVKHLNNYLQAVRGPLKDHNWNTSRAEELLQYLQS